MIFKTITDETTLSGQRIVGALQARKIAQQQATAQLEIDIACLKEYQVVCQNGTVTTEQFDAIMHKASASAVEYSAKVKAGTGTAQSYANAQRATNSALQEVSIGAGIASKAVKLFSAALNMIAFTAIIQGVSWLIGKVDEWIVTAKEAKESANAFKESLSTFFNETQSNLKTISSLSDRFDELSKNVDDNGKKVDGTEEEYAEFLDICQQVGQIMPELITGYTAEGEAIITLQGKVDSLTDSYKEAIKAKAALFISKGDEEGNTIESFFEDYDNFINGTQKGWFSFSPSPQFSKTTKYEEYYGYDQIHEWLSNVNGKTLEELNNQIKSTTGQIQNVYLRKVLEEAEFDINNITEENYNAVHDVLNNKLIVMEKELSDRVINIRSAFQNMLYADSDYWNIDDENVLSAINSLYGSIDAEFIKNNELFSQKALQTFESDFVSLFNNDATKQAMVDFYTPIADDETVNDYADRIKSSLETVQSYCDENGITVPINFDDSEQTINDLEAQYQRAVDFAKDKFDGYDPTAFFKEHSINTQEEIDAWQEIAQGARDAAEAEREYIQGSTLNENPISLSLTETIDQLNTQLKPTFDSLKSAYENIFTTDDNGKPLFTLENVDLSMLDSIKSAIDDLNENEELGISIDYTSFENLARTLTDTASTENDVRNGFNEFITDIVYGTTALDNLNASDAKLVETMLESLGVTNAHEIVYESLIAKTEALTLEEQLLSSVGGDLTNATADKVLAFLNQAGASEVARNYLIKLIAEEQVFSNQDLDVSGKISKLQELAQAYGQTALAAKIASQEKANEQSHTVGSWSEADLQQFQKEWNDGLSSVSIDFSPKSSSKSKKSGSSKSEKDLWLEEYKRKLAELQNLLAKGRLMPSPVVIQDV